jgi:DNA-binding NarL/FixJ family response regulator
MTLDVLLADDDPLVRAGLKMILSAAGDLRVTGEAPDGAAALAAVTASRPDVVLMDIRMPDMDGIEATGKIRALPDPPQVIVLTTFHLDEYVFGALRAGAGGFLLKDTAPADIAAAIRLVAAGDAMLSPAVTRTLLERFGDPRPERKTATLRELTPRELEVATEVARGHSNAEIGTRLYMSEATVKAHVSRVLVKLGVTNRVQVAIAVRDAGLVLRAPVLRAPVLRAKDGRRWTQAGISATTARGCATCWRATGPCSRGFAPRSHSPGSASWWPGSGWTRVSWCCRGCSGSS